MQIEFLWKFSQGKNIIFFLSAFILPSIIVLLPWRTGGSLEMCQQVALKLTSKNLSNQRREKNSLKRRKRRILLLNLRCGGDNQEKITILNNIIFHWFTQFQQNFRFLFTEETFFEAFWYDTLRYRWWNYFRSFFRCRIRLFAAFKISVSDFKFEETQFYWQRMRWERMKAKSLANKHRLSFYDD